MPVLIRPAVRRMAAYRPPQEGREGLLLDFNENTAGCSPAVLAALRATEAGELARYPEYSRAEAAIAAAFGHSPETALLTNGVDDAIQLAVLTVLDAGAEALVVEPTFAMYRFYCEQAGADLCAPRYGERTIAPGVREFVFPAVAVRAAINARTRALFVASPNNPTGTLTPRKELLALAQDFPDCLLFVDEAYMDFAGLAGPGPDDTSLLADVHRQPNLLVARTFSKAYGLAGARLGCLFAHPDLMPMLRRAHSPYNVNALAARCGVAAVNDAAWARAYCREAILAREIIERTLHGLGIPYWRSAANFVLFDAGAHCDAVLAGMRARGIRIRDRRGDHPGALRITCGTQEQTGVACDALSAVWKELTS